MDDAGHGSMDARFAARCVSIFARFVSISPLAKDQYFICLILTAMFQDSLGQCIKKSIRCIPSSECGDLL